MSLLLAASLSTIAAAPILVPFDGLTHLSSLSLHWRAGAAPAPFTVVASVDGTTWRPVLRASTHLAEAQAMDAVGALFRVEVPTAADVTEVTYAAEPARNSDAANIFIGTNNDGAGYSRGNQYPGVHAPFGMAAWSVGTQNLTESWFYDYKDEAISGIKLTHQPTVWSGDFAAFDVMPLTGGLSADYAARRSPFLRENEVARPYYYKNTLDRYGITFEIAPSDRGGILRFAYPAGKTPYLALGGRGVEGAKVQAVGLNGLSGQIANGGVTAYFYAEFDQPISALTSGAPLLAGLEFAPSAGNVITMKVATSYVSAAQAKDNFALELETQSLATLKAETQAKWEQAFAKVEIAGGTAAERMTFYSAFYRLLAFPKMHWEPIGRAAGSSQYQSPFDGQVHLNRKLWTGNGFWDTYRGVWPLFSLLFPAQTGEMLDGIVNSYKDGGWTVRWSNPGYWDCMIGTHSDVIFADAFVKGIRNWDYTTGYEASVKNAMVAGAPAGRGRRFLERSAFLGYVPWTDAGANDEVGARTMEDAVNDFGLSQFAGALAKEGDAAYFRNRSLGYANLWSAATGHFRGKYADGRWRSADADFNPFAWHYEWTEGNAWQYRAAPMHDGVGLAALFGGREKLEAGLDEILAASPQFDVGGYGGVIHEMLEARTAGELGFGQFAIGNEPDHHLLHMYAFAGKPAKTQYWVRRALSQLFSPGFADGHGYPGDEDNGQMSAWYVMNAMGFYSASPAHPEYYLSSPVFDAVTLHLDNGKTFAIKSEHNDAAHVYIADAKLNGEPFDQAFLSHATILAGGELDLNLSEEPSHWGERPEAMPAAVTAFGGAPRYRPNLAAGAAVRGSGENRPTEILKNLVDNDSKTKWLTFAAQGTVDVRLAQATAVDTYTLTSANDAPARDPRAWRLLGSNDGKDWTVLDAQEDIVWTNRLETKAFYLANRVPYAYYRLDVSANGGADALQLAEFELRALNDHSEAAQAF